MIGGSTPSHHWERGGFADMALAHNPLVWVMVQHSWGDVTTGAIMQARHGLAPEPAPDAVGTNEDRDAGRPELAALRERMGAQLGRLGSSSRASTTATAGPLTTLVPAGEAVLRLREAVVAGDLPGVDRQSQLFRDALGHATQPTTGPSPA